MNDAQKEDFRVMLLQSLQNSKMDPSLKKSLVSIEQMHSLLEFMKEHPDLARGLSRGRRGKLTNLRIWGNCAKKLNDITPGAVKNGKGWSKYWCDWKYRVRRRALELRAARDNETAAAEPPTQLSDMEETLISIIGQDFLERLKIKTNPLDEDSNEEEDDQDELNEAAGEERYDKKTKRRRKRPVSTRDNSDAEEMSEEPYAPPRNKASREEDDYTESDSDQEAAQFLNLERMKLENSIKMLTAIQNVATQIQRLTDVICDLRDRVLNKVVV